MSKIDTPSSYNTSHFRLKHVLFIHQISISRWKIKQYGTITKNKTISYLNDEKIHRKNKKETPGLCENDLKKKKKRYIRCIWVILKQNNGLKSLIFKE